MNCRKSNASMDQNENTYAVLAWQLSGISGKVRADWSFCHADCPNDLATIHACDRLEKAVKRKM